MTMAMTTSVPSTLRSSCESPLGLCRAGQSRARGDEDLPSVAGSHCSASHHHRTPDDLESHAFDGSSGTAGGTRSSDSLRGDSVAVRPVVEAPSPPAHRGSIHTD